MRSPTLVASSFEDVLVACRTFRTIPERELPLRHRVGGMPTVPAVDPAVWRLHVSFYLTRRPQDLECLVAHYSSHTRTLARRMHREREPLDDLVQVSNEALLLALGRFEPDRRKPFLGYANPTIIGTLKRYYRDAGWSIRVPRRVHALARPVREAEELLSQDLGRRPTSGEIADFLGVDTALVREATAAHAARSTRSLSITSGENSPAMADRIGFDDGGISRVELHAALEQTISRLPESDRELLQMYFVNQMRQSDIADHFGCSQMQISRSLRRVLRQLRAYLPVEPGND